jgi:hypothetical protein
MMDELEGLIGQAALVDGEVAAAAPGAVLEAQAEAEVMGLAEENGQGVALILDLAVPILGKLYPSLLDVYTPEACAAVAASMGPVLAKYGINLKEWGGAYKEEIGALFVCGPIAWATVAGIKADIAARAGAPAAKVISDGAAPTKREHMPVPGDFDYREPVEA